MLRALLLVLSFLVATGSLLYLSDGPGWRYGYTYQKDELQTLCQIQAVFETGNQLTPTRLNGGQGDWRDFPMHLPVETLLVSVMGKLGLTAFQAASLNWAFMVGLTSMLAYLAFTELNLPPPVAFAFAIIYALQPFPWEHNLWHWHLNFAWIPGAAVVLLRFSEGRLPQSRWLWVNLFLLGLSSLYYSFFLFWLLIPTLLMAASKASPGFWRGAGGLLLCFSLGLAMQAAMCLRKADRPEHLRTGAGPVVSTTRRNPADAERYSLRLRFLACPRPNHPLTACNRLEAKLDWEFDRHVRESEREQNEATRTRLGTLATAGLLLLPLAALRFRSDGWVKAAAVLSLCVLAVGVSGGFGSLFNALFFTSFRCYNRMVVFLSFFALAALARCLQQAGWATLLLVVPALWDQHVPSAASVHANVPDLSHPYRADQAWVQQVESLLPPATRLYQLPPHLALAHADYEQHREYDHAIGYLFSRTLLWSWGYLPGFQQERWDRLAALPAGQQLAELHRWGYGAVWFDRYGYVDQAQYWELNLRHHLGPPLAVSENGRFALFRLRAPQAADLASLPEENTEPARIELQAPVAAFSTLAGTPVRLLVRVHNRGRQALSGAGPRGRFLVAEWTGLETLGGRTALPFILPGESMEVPVRVLTPRQTATQALQLWVGRERSVEASGPSLTVNVRRW